MTTKARDRSRYDLYHVGNRGARKLPIFGDDRDRGRYLNIVADTARHFDFNVVTYCLVPNHYHLIVRTPFEQLAGGMHRVGTLYAQYFNWRYELDGPLWTRRFWSAPLNDERRVLATARYIERNAWDVEPGTALREYRWSSFGAIMGRRSLPFFVEPGILIQQFNGDRKAYADFVESDRTPKPGPVVPASEHAQRFDQTEIDAAVAGVFTASGSASSGSHVTVAKVTLILSREFGTLSGGELASRYGYANAASVKSLTSRARREVRSDPLLAARLTMARQLLIGNASSIAA